MRKVTVRAIILDNEGGLLCVRNRHHAKSEGNFWCLPGGNVDEQEPLLAALKREIVEETGVVPQLGKLVYVQQFGRGDIDFLEFFFHVTNAQDFLEVDLSKTSHGEAEIAEIAFVDPATTYILPKFLTTEPIREQIDGKEHVKIFSY